jgi:hypothetical protein
MQHTLISRRRGCSTKPAQKGQHHIENRTKNIYSSATKCAKNNTLKGTPHDELITGILSL